MPTELGHAPAVRLVNREMYGLLKEMGHGPEACFNTAIMSTVFSVHDLCMMDVASDKLLGEWSHLVKYGALYCEFIQQLQAVSPCQTQGRVLFPVQADHVCPGGDQGPYGHLPIVESTKWLWMTRAELTNTVNSDRAALVRAIGIWLVGHPPGPQERDQLVVKPTLTSRGLLLVPGWGSEDIALHQQQWTEVLLKDAIDRLGLAAVASTALFARWVESCK